jgi:hypothetical protein
MSTNTLIQRAIDLVRQIPVKSDPTDALYRLCLETLNTLEEALKPKSPIEDLLDEIDVTFDAICNSVCAGPQEEVIKRLQKALKHLDKALTIMEGEDD